MGRLWNNGLLGADRGKAPCFDHLLLFCLSLCSCCVSLVVCFMSLCNNLLSLYHHFASLCGCLFVVCFISVRCCSATLCSFVSLCCWQFDHRHFSHQQIVINKPLFVSIKLDYHVLFLYNYIQFLKFLKNCSVKLCFCFILKKKKIFLEAEQEFF